DILSGITGVSFADAWERRITVRLGEHDVAVLSKVDFIANKTAVGRPKDLADMALLDEADGVDPWGGLALLPPFDDPPDQRRQIREALDRVGRHRVAGTIVVAAVGVAG